MRSNKYSAIWAYARRTESLMLIVLLEEGQATSDDIRRLIERPVGVPVDCSAVDATITLKAAGIVRQAGRVRSFLHGREIDLWQLIDRNGAKERLFDLLCKTAKLPPPPNCPLFADSNRVKGVERCQ